MTLMRQVVSSDFFAINLTPEEARPGTEPPRHVLEFLSTHSVITAVIYGNARTPELQVAGKHAVILSYFYESFTKQRSGFQRSIYQKENGSIEQGDERDCSNKTMINFTFCIIWGIKRLF